MFVSGSGLIDVWDSVGEIGRKSMFEEEKKEVKNETTSLWCVCLQSIGRSMGGMNEGSSNSFTDSCRVYVVIAKMICEKNLLGLHFLHELGKRDIPHFLRRGMTEN